jgi:hypothetical protein
MWIALALVALIIVAAVIAVLFRRPEGDDIDSVRSYHSALGTLEHLSERTHTSVSIVEHDDRAGMEPGVPRSYRRASGAAGGAARGATGSSGTSVGVGTGRAVPPVPVRGNDEFPDPEIPLIFDDSRPRDRIRPDAASGDGIPVSRTDRAQRHALDSMNHRPRRTTTVLVVVAAVVLFGVLAYVGSKRSSPGHPHAAAATSTTAARTSHAGSATTVARSPGTTAASGAHKAKAKVHVATTTPTTQPTQVVALTSTSSTATYPVTNSNYKVTVTGTGSCWVAVTSSSSGSTIWAGEVQAGGVQTVAASGSVTVQLGTPEVTLAIDKVPVVLPTPISAPFVATFQPTAAALAASPPTTTTTTTTTKVASTSSTTPP